jgi:hypothetical protein
VKHAFDLNGLADPANILLLRNVFTNPEALNPGKTRTAITEEVAARFARLAQGMAGRGIAPHDAAHYRHSERMQVMSLTINDPSTLHRIERGIEFPARCCV